MQSISFGLRLSLSVSPALPLIWTSVERIVVSYINMVFHLNGVEFQFPLHEWHWKGERRDDVAVYLSISLNTQKLQQQQQQQQNVSHSNSYRITF